MKAHYSPLGCPSVCPELMVRMLIVGHYYSIRSERRLYQEAKLNMAYRWFCGLGLEDRVSDHSTFSVNRHGRFHDSDIPSASPRRCPPPTPRRLGRRAGVTR